jgi:hypothetical protein
MVTLLRKIAMPNSGDYKESARARSAGCNHVASRR